MTRSGLRGAPTENANGVTETVTPFGNVLGLRARRRADQYSRRASSLPFFE